MKIRKTLQASVHLTIDERKTLESALDVLIEIGRELDKIKYFGVDTPENIVAMDSDVSHAGYCLEKILSDTEK